MESNNRYVDSLNQRTRIGAKQCGNVDRKKDTTLVGLELSEPIYREIGFFKENPENEVFRPLKTEEYYIGLERDMVEAGCITSPLIAMPSGVLLEGESRYRIAKRLVEQGNDIFSKLPVRIILSSISEEEQRKRLYLGNLSRFQIDEDTRLLLYGKIWPTYFSAPLRTGRPKKEDMMSDYQTPAGIASANHMSDRQVRREKAVYKRAIDNAKKIGKEEPGVIDIKHAREELRDEKHSKSRMGLTTRGNEQDNGNNCEFLDQFIKHINTLSLKLEEENGYYKINLVFHNEAETWEYILSRIVEIDGIDDSNKNKLKYEKDRLGKICKRLAATSMQDDCLTID